jgi:hypothetical protein
MGCEMPGEGVVGGSRVGVGWVTLRTGVPVGTAVSTRLLVAMGVLLGDGVAVADGRSTVTTSANGACGVGLLVAVQPTRTAVAQTTTTIQFAFTDLCFMNSLHMALVDGCILA